MGNFAAHKKPVNNRCFGVEVEGYISVRSPIQYRQLRGDVYCSSDGSLNGAYDDEKDVELITQPLPYKEVVKALRKQKRIKTWRTDADCGVHVHVGRGVCSTRKASALAAAIGKLSDNQFAELFGRKPTYYCRNSGITLHGILRRGAIANREEKHTTEFRMFPSKDFDWAIECTRRVKVLCEMEAPYTYERIKEAFGI